MVSASALLAGEARLLASRLSLGRNVSLLSLALWCLLLAVLLLAAHLLPALPRLTTALLALLALMTHELACLRVTLLGPGRVPAAATPTLLSSSLSTAALALLASALPALLPALLTRELTLLVALLALSRMLTATAAASLLVLRSLLLATPSVSTLLPILWTHWCVTSRQGRPTGDQGSSRDAQKGVVAPSTCTVFTSYVRRHSKDDPSE